MEYLSIEELYEKAGNYFKRGKYQKDLLCSLQLIELDDPRGYTRIAWLYDFGLGVEKDIHYAKELYEKVTTKPSFERTHPRVVALAYNNLGMNCTGIYGFEKDLPNAIRLFKKAVKLGDNHAPINLAEIYNGTYDDSVVNYRKARKYYEKAIAVNNGAGYIPLARYYYYGIGGPKDKKKTLEYLTLGLHSLGTLPDQRLDTDYLFIEDYLTSNNAGKIENSQIVILHYINENRKLKAENHRLREHINASPDGKTYFEAYEHYEKTSNLQTTTRIS